MIVMAVCLRGQAQLPGAPSNAASLAQQIQAMVAESAVARAHWGVMVTSMDGEPIFALNEGQLFQPASNTKLFTTAAALALLQPGSRFETRVIARGTPVNGVLKGDLVLRGDGDANLSGRTIPYAEPPAKQDGLPALHVLDEMADAIAATGLKRIEGDFVGDDTLFPWQPYAIDWAQDDLVWGYGAPVSALTINDNQLKLTIAPGRLPAVRSAHQMDGPVPAHVSVEPATEYYSIRNEVVTTEPKTKSAVEIERLPGSRVLRVFGTMAEDAKPEVEEIAIDDPAEYAAMALKERLEARGIGVTGKALARHRPLDNPAGFLEQARAPLAALGAGPQGGIAPCLRCGTTRDVPGDEVLAVRRSATVGEDVVVTNKESQNLHAELLLHQLGVAFAADGSTAQGARVVRQFLLNAGVDKDDFVFFDGSGMSGHDRVTPRAIAKLLHFASKQPWFAEYKASLPVGGVDGTLENRFTKPPLKGHVFAKTGTNSESRALSGYLECASGRTVIFSILVGDHAPGSSAEREVMDRMVAAIAAAE